LEGYNNKDYPRKFGIFSHMVSEEKKKIIVKAAMFVGKSGQNEQSLWRTFHGCFLPGFGSFGKTVAEENILRDRPTRNKNCI
jgi:hypothetical protein